MKTVVVNPKNINRSWFIVDATDQILGRLASRVASILIGKNKPAYSPNQDHGDYVVVINAEKIRLTGKKPLTKEYFSHSRHPGHERYRPFGTQMRIDPTRVITHAVKGMVPKTTLGRHMLKKLHVYKGKEHPHGAQKPRELQFHN